MNDFKWACLQFYFGEISQQDCCSCSFLQRSRRFYFERLVEENMKQSIIFYVVEMEGAFFN